MPPDVAPPCWMDEASLRRLRRARAEARDLGQAPQAAIIAMRDLLWCRHPALPLTAIDEATRLILDDRDDVGAPRCALPEGAAAKRATPPGRLAARMLGLATRLRGRAVPWPGTKPGESSEAGHRNPTP